MTLRQSGGLYISGPATKLRIPIVGGGEQEVWAGTLAQLQALGSGNSDVAEGDTAVRSDVKGQRFLECISVAAGNTTWGYRQEFWLQIAGSSSSTSDQERFACYPTSFTVGSSPQLLGVQFLFPELYGADKLEILANTGRFLRNSDPGSTDLNLYKNGNPVAIDSDTVDPGADTEAPFDIAGEVEAGEWLEFGVDPTNSRVTWEKTYAFVRAVRTYTVTE